MPDLDLEACIRDTPALAALLWAADREELRRLLGLTQEPQEIAGGGGT
jgi:hypothetical protein